MNSPQTTEVSAPDVDELMSMLNRLLRRITRTFAVMAYVVPLVIGRELSPMVSSTK